RRIRHHLGDEASGTTRPDASSGRHGTTTLPTAGVELHSGPLPRFTEPKTVATTSPGPVSTSVDRLGYAPSRATVPARPLVRLCHATRTCPAAGTGHRASRGENRTWPPGLPASGPGCAVTGVHDASPPWLMQPMVIAVPRG